MLLYEYAGHVLCTYLCNYVHAAILFVGVIAIYRQHIRGGKRFRSLYTLYNNVTTNTCNKNFAMPCTLVLRHVC